MSAPRRDKRQDPPGVLYHELVHLALGYAGLAYVRQKVFQDIRIPEPAILLQVRLPADILGDENAVLVPGIQQSGDRLCGPLGEADLRRLLPLLEGSQSFGPAQEIEL